MIEAGERTRLEVAFAIYVVRLILAADGVVEPDEVEHFLRVFPATLLEELGFIDEDGNDTAALEAAQAEALKKLPRGLALREKLALLEMFHEAALADDRLEPDELRLLADGARFLGVGERTFTEFMVRRSLAHHGIPEHTVLDVSHVLLEG